ncbi:hypothetical protein LINPERPRIM_LOCUS16990 [Linum perenne]
MRRSSSSGNFSRKLQPAKRALRRFASKVRSKLTEIDFPGAIRVIRNRTNRIITYCSNHLFRHNRSLKPNKTPSYRRHNHHNYISDYYSSNRNLLHHNFSAIYIDQLYAEEQQAASTSRPAAADRDRSNLKTSTATAVPEATIPDRAPERRERGKEVVVSSYNNKRPPLPVPVARKSNYGCREGGEKTVPSLVQRRKKKEHVVIVEEKENSSDSNNPMETLEDAWREVVARSPQLRPVDVRAEEFIHNVRADMKIQKDNSIVEYRKLLAGGS